MKRRLTLTEHLQSVIRELSTERKYVLPDQDEECDDKINEYLTDKVKEDPRNILKINKLVRDKFKKSLVEETMLGMSDDEDYSNETINKKINKKITEQVNKWLVEKMKDNE